MKKSSVSLFMSSLVLIVFGLITSVGASAHPGHGHHHWVFEYHHVFGLLSVVISLLILSYCFFKRYQVKRKKLLGDR